MILSLIILLELEVPRVQLWIQLAKNSIEHNIDTYVQWMLKNVLEAADATAEVILL